MKCLCLTFGSGGHTGEMLQILNVLDLSGIGKIFAVVFENDNMTLSKIAAYNKNVEIQSQADKIQNSIVKISNIVLVPRARNVGQNIITCLPKLFLGTIIAFFRLAFTNFPDIVSYFANLDRF